jgi:hypothetical protein
MKSSECAAWNCDRAIGLFSHFADHVCSKYFRVVHLNHSQNEDQQPLRHHAITASLHNSRNYVSPTSAPNVIIFEFRLMAV